MDVRISKKNIKYGRRENETSCPIALALKDLGLKHVAVRDYEVRFVKNGTCFDYKPSNRAADFIFRFDEYVDKKHFKPTTFRFGLRSKKPLKAVRANGEVWWNENR